MEQFFKALVSEAKNAAIPEEFNYFGKLVGNWNITYVDHNHSRSISGEWYFSWILEGMAIQDVIILPSRAARDEYHHPDEEYGTTLRIYNPKTNAWDIAYGYTGKIMRLEAKKQDDMIVLTNLENPKQKWVFVKIENTKFHWQNVTVKEDGFWHINVDIFAERIIK